MDLSPAKLRPHFHKLSDDYEAIEKKLIPLWAELGEIVSGKADMSLKDAQKREQAIRDKIRALQDEQFPIEQERAAVARALGGKTGQPE